MAVIFYCWHYFQSLYRWGSGGVEKLGISQSCYSQIICELGIEPRLLPPGATTFQYFQGTTGPSNQANVDAQL
jgi:hypothetical protein